MRHLLVEPFFVSSITEKQRIIAISAAAAGAQSLIALVTNSFPVFFGTYGPHVVTGMLDVYYDYSTRALAGSIPYRDYLVEYPILGFLTFLIPHLFVSSYSGYRIAFGVELLLFNAMAVFLVARQITAEEGFAQVPSRLTWYTAFFASLCPLLMGPFDLAPMAVAFAAALAWFHRKNTLGGILAGVGVLMKIFPGVVAAPALVWEVAHRRESRGRGVLAFLGTIALGMSFWLGLGGTGVANSLRYHAERGLEVGSIYTGVVILLARLKGEKVKWALHHNSLHLAPEWGDAIARWALPLQIAALLLVMWRYHRSGMKDGVRYAGAALLAFMVFGKVFSPQYLIWLIPFMTVLGGPTGTRARWIYLLACVATTIIYPLIALRLMIERNSLGAMILMNYRNALLVGLYILLLFGPETAAKPPATRMDR
jgi:hypothetical protein